MSVTPSISKWRNSPSDNLSTEYESFRWPIRLDQNRDFEFDSIMVAALQSISSEMQLLMWLRIVGIIMAVRISETDKLALTKEWNDLFTV